tara:strand:- start:13230 stop:13766 length:537 start_codon:yes stop_codon:yes gene_type:complete
MLPLKQKMNDNLLHLLTFLAYIFRDALFLAFVLTRARANHILVAYSLNIFSYSLFTFGYCFYYVQYAIDNVITRLMAPEKKEMVWFFIIALWVNAAQQVCLLYFFLTSSLWQNGKRMSGTTVTAILVGCASVIASVVSCLMNPASLYVPDSVQAWVFVYVIVQVCLLLSLLYVLWKQV